MNYEIKQQDKFRFIEEGQGETLLLLHGLFGALSNFEDLIEHFKRNYKVVVPILPLFDLDIFHTTVSGLEKYVHKFIEMRGYQQIHLLGNSLGGHVALLHILKHPERIKSLILTGSSGLFENGMGDSYPKRGDYDYIKKKTELTFYDPATATKELVDEVFEITNNRIKVIKIIALAKSAIRNNLGEELNQIKQPTLLIWGNNDSVTPPFVGREFNRLIPNSELHFVDKCGHAPMMEVPEAFNEILAGFLNKLKKPAATIA
ncbi:Pimeloyl-ACP methyl ester carboxylesterase [Hydrobacter penzbergensis]|jgi:2-hydroxy-6-oxonona-2,4-dienedioate hydrolase|uniref:Pimeloyl-ACP methyl ester carboxylesterase n=1 Tax=Hydrobacter penzbergensis TaxID=1235997 RepID=A0A8X8IEK4_9BACT|nr:alpha/beta hydrolase [Hydrobacter penzbergensis]MBN8720224.1 alpha/beta hydrolase [Sediminibacterium magnilacihabitans]PQV59832.1 pimeloyl-ACP methyl ester carboxylesterase [Sediminibacterium magnilacihabitans]SDW70879.1 Pimeloyl-ACP methyl ester carboxylesterase [Hydrobacter penzbergensis]